VEFETKTGSAFVEVANGKKVECSEIDTKGKVISEVKAVALTLYVGCKTTAFIFEGTCTSAGAPSGDVHVPHDSILLGSASGTEMIPAVLLQATNAETGEPTGVKAACEVAGQRAEVSLHGAQVCLIKNAPNKIEVEVSCEQGTKAGEAKDKFFWDSSESGVENTLKASSTGAEEFENIEAVIVGNGQGRGKSGTIQIET
jgi:hypothetical protein